MHTVEHVGEVGLGRCARSALCVGCLVNQSAAHRAYEEYEVSKP